MMENKQSINLLENTLAFIEPFDLDRFEYFIINKFRCYTLLIYYYYESIPLKHVSSKLRILKTTEQFQLY